jgi:hypothetical protein
MTQENEEFKAKFDEAKEKERKSKEAEAIFEANALTKPKLKVEIPESRRSASFSESEDSLGNPSNLQVILKRLFPTFPYKVLNQTCQAVMVGRILPDVMLNRIKLTVIAIVEEWDEEEDGWINIQAIIDMVTTAYEIGLNSKGRVDAVEVNTGVKETEELEKLANSMA